MVGVGAFVLIVAIIIIHWLRRKNMCPASIELGDSGPDARPLTVTEFTRRVKDVLEGGIAPCWVKGEISNLRVQPSGHVYFSLKDAGAQLSAVMFRTQAARQSVKPRDGLQVVAYGEVGVYEPRGQYQLVVKTLVDDGVERAPAGIRSPQAPALADEGLFDAARKKPLPPDARSRRLCPRRRREPRCRISCAYLSVAAGGAGSSSFPPRSRATVPPPRWCLMLETAVGLGIFDLIVIGRGGGSIEDLWAFNEESLVRAVALACPVPTISAVGHEIDFTLCDFADRPAGGDPERRGGTDLERVCAIGRADGVGRRGGGRGVVRGREPGAGRRVAHEALAARRLLSPSALVERGYLCLDDMTGRLGSALRSSVQLRRHALAGVAARLDKSSPETRVQIESHRVHSLYKSLQGSSPTSVLYRGFSIMLYETGMPVTRRAGIDSGRRLEAELADGRLPLRAE